MTDQFAPAGVGGSPAGAFTSSPQTDEVIAAYVEALGELSEVPKARTAQAGSYSYSYAGLDAVLGEIRPVLARHSLALSQAATVVDGDVEVTTWVWHSSGQWLRFAPLRLPAGQTAQQTGSAITYARRYSAMAVCGLASGDDDDGQGAASRAQPPTLSEENQQRFVQAATDAGVVVADVVYAATGGRTDDPAAVYVTEVQSLRDALKAASQSSGGASPASGTPPDTLEEQ